MGARVLCLYVRPFATVQVRFRQYSGVWLQLHSPFPLFLSSVGRQFSCRNKMSLQIQSDGRSNELNFYHLCSQLAQSKQIGLSATQPMHAISYTLPKFLWFICCIAYTGHWFLSAGLVSSSCPGIRCKTNHPVSSKKIFLGTLFFLLHTQLTLVEL